MTRDAIIALTAQRAATAEAAYQADRNVTTRDIAYTWADLAARAAAMGDSKSEARRLTQEIADADAYHA